MNIGGNLSVGFSLSVRSQQISRLGLCVLFPPSSMYKTQWILITSVPHWSISSLTPERWLSHSAWLLSAAPAAWHSMRTLQKQFRQSIASYEQALARVEPAGKLSSWGWARCQRTLHRASLACLAVCHGAGFTRGVPEELRALRQSPNPLMTNNKTSP